MRDRSIQGAYLVGGAMAEDLLRIAAVQRELRAFICKTKQDGGVTVNDSNLWPFSESFICSAFII